MQELRKRKIYSQFPWHNVGFGAFSRRFISQPFSEVLKTNNLVVKIRSKIAMALENREFLAQGLQLFSRSFLSTRLDHSLPGLRWFKIDNNLVHKTQDK